MVIHMFYITILGSFIVLIGREKIKMVKNVYIYILTNSGILYKFVHLNTNSPF